MVRFITKGMALRIHHDQIERYGGDLTLRDEGLLESALAMPAAEFGGQHLHAFPHEMAAAYLFHLGRNHPFVDGNKRVALATALVFLKLNGIRFACDADEVERFVVSLMTGEKDKADAAVFFRERIRE